MIASRPVAGARHPFPILRVVVVAFLAVYLPAYAMAYGFANFLFLCNLSAILSAAGVLWASPLLLSSQLLAATLVGAVWAADAGARLLLGRHVFGATEYMWDPRWPLLTRSLSLYHLALPPLLLWAVSRTGYDRRGFALQSCLALAGVLAGRLLGPAVNINYAFADPFFKRSLGPAPVHVAVTAGALILVAYLPLHALLLHVMPPRRVS
jgi:hypothetical protein